MENKKFTKRVFGCAVIKSINGNYNADFTKQPRTLPDGTVYATDKALKYTIRYYLYQNFHDDNILYFTRNKIILETGQMVPKSLRELYEHLFGKLPKGLSNKEPEKFILLQYDGNKIDGILPKPVQKEELDKYLKNDNNEDALITLKDIFINFLKNANESRPTDIKESDIKDIIGDVEDESFYFFIDKKDKKPKKIIIGDNEQFEKAISQYELIALGGYDKLKILYNLLQCIDVRLFGATYTGDTNVSIHGPVQINHAKDRYFYKDNAIENLTYTEQIKSPVRNDKSKGGEAEMTTIGSQSKSMEAHYVHHFSINPQNLEDHVSSANMITTRKEAKEQVLVGLQKPDIDKLIEGLRLGATNYDSTAKAGVENELLVWVELLDNCKIVLPNFTEYIKITRNEQNTIEIDLKDLKMLLEKDYIKECIEKINLYYNDVLGKPINIPLIEGKVFEYDIFTGSQLNVQQVNK